MIVPMRYRCRLPGWTAKDEIEKPGTYNARRDKLSTVWRKLFGQVLAILYVVVSCEEPTVILIDEPQSFLHPGAVRKLMEILRSYNQHQYIITTHSPIPIGQSEEDRLFIVRRDNVGSRIYPISQTSQNDLRSFLAEVGARYSDIFGMDSILWVEGKTEEMCFPVLLRKLGGVTLAGIQILGVVSTDELATKHASRVFDIYARLAGGSSLLPPAIAFVLDKEDRTPADMDDIERKSGGTPIDAANTVAPKKTRYIFMHPPCDPSRPRAFQELSAIP